MSDRKYSQNTHRKIVNNEGNPGSGTGNKIAPERSKVFTPVVGTRINIPVDKLATKGNAVSNAQQIERNRGAIQINQHQQSLLKVKDRNFVDTEYGNATEVYGNYIPDDDEYESAGVDDSYNYKQSADDLMKERARYS